MYSKITNSVKVSVIPEYDAKNSYPSENRFVFRYNVEIENLSDAYIKVMSRNWLVYDVGFGYAEVNGAGVIGLTPEIEPGSRFSYFSNVALRSGIGYMRGDYTVKNMQTGEEMHIMIPTFELFSNLLSN